MNKKYVKPQAEISAFESEEIIALSGVNAIIGAENVGKGVVYTSSWNSNWDN